MERRAAWLTCVKEARIHLIGGLPHVEWARLEALLEGSARPSDAAFVEGSTREIAMRRLVGGCVAPPSSTSGNSSSLVDATLSVAQAYEAGMLLQREAWEQASELRDSISTATKERAKARQWARRWRMAVVRGGPARAAALAEAAAARADMREAIADARTSGELGEEAVYELGAAGARRIREHLMLARGLRTSVSYRAALREWRWLAMLRQWRLRAAVKVGHVLEPMASVRSDVLSMVDTWGEETCVRGSHPRPPPASVWLDRPDVGARARDGLEARALTPRAKLRWCGGRRLFDRLKGAAVQAGHEPDRFGFWAVEAVIDVRRPAKRRGQQLDVLVQFAGLDPLLKTPWPQEWVPITWLKPDVKATARAMERASSAAAAASESGAAAAAACAGSKRPWSGLIWDGADEGRPRRGRSGHRIVPVPAPASALASAPPPAAALDPGPAVINALPMNNNAATAHLICAVAVPSAASGSTIARVPAFLTAAIAPPHTVLPSVAAAPHTTALLPPAIAFVPPSAAATLPTVSAASYNDSASAAAAVSAHVLASAAGAVEAARAAVGKAAAVTGQVRKRSAAAMLATVVAPPPVYAYNVPRSGPPAGTATAMARPLGHEVGEAQRGGERTKQTGVGEGARRDAGAPTGEPGAPTRIHEEVRTASEDGERRCGCGFGYHCKSHRLADNGP